MSENEKSLISKENSSENVSLIKNHFLKFLSNVVQMIPGWSKRYEKGVKIVERDKEKILKLRTEQNDLLNDNFSMQKEKMKMENEYEKLKCDFTLLNTKWEEKKEIESPLGLYLIGLVILMFVFVMLSVSKKTK